MHDPENLNKLAADSAAMKLLMFELLTYLAEEKGTDEIKKIIDNALEPVTHYETDDAYMTLAGRLDKDTAQVLGDFADNLRKRTRPVLSWRANSARPKR